MKIHPRTKFNPKIGQSFKFTFSIPVGMILVVDTREQDALFKKPPKGLLMVRDTLEVGDYSLKGFEGKVTLERKTILDLLNCLGNDRERFKRELERMKEFEFKGILVEGNEDDLYQHHDFSLMHPEAIRQSVVSIEIRHGVHFYFGSREKLERVCLDRLIKFWRVKREG